MRQLLLSAALASLLVPTAAAQTPATPPTGNSPTSAQRPEVAAAATRLQDEVVELRRWFHTHPELSNREDQTAAQVAEHLRSPALEPRPGIAHPPPPAITETANPAPHIH